VDDANDENGAPASRSNGPIFVVGSMGSGTTLLRLILDSHDNIAIAQETCFLRSAVAQRQVPFWRFGGDWHARLGWDADEFDARIAAFYSEVFGRWAASQGAGRWGDKTPQHVWMIDVAAEIFPDAAIVATVRHPGATTASNVQRFEYAWKPMVGHWVKANREMVHQARKLGERFALLRYEDLVLSPEASLRELLAWLDEPWSPQVLEHHEVQRDKGTSSVVEGRTRSSDAIDAKRVTRWVESVRPADLAMLKRSTAGLAEFFGYSFTDAAALAPVASGGNRTYLMTGTDLAARAESMRQVVDFDTRPAPAFENRPLRPSLLRVERDKARDAGVREGLRQAAASAPAPAPEPTRPLERIRRSLGVGSRPEPNR
jgi:hypothetical protein